jgi:hypothetical protein
MTAETVVSQVLRLASATLDDVPHRRRNASYPEDLRNDPKHGVFLNQDTSLAAQVQCCRRRYDVNGSGLQNIALARL